MSVINDPVSVEIYGQIYNVRGEGDPAYLTELAKLVDTRMREIAGQFSAIDPMKIAILAALNIADEYSRYKSQQQSAAGIWMEKAEEITEKLSRSLNETAAKR